MAYPVGVIQRTFDESLYETAPAGTILGVVLVAHKGPINEVTEIVSPTELVSTFGLPTTQGMIASMLFLRESSRLYVVRVEDGTADYSDNNLTVALTNILTVKALTKGTWGDDIDIITVLAEDGDVSHVNLQVYYKDVMVEEWTNIGSFVEAEAIDSEWVTFEEAAGSPAWPAAWTGEYRSYALTGGASGTAVTAADFVGTLAVPPGTPATGLHLFDNPEDVELDLVACPGESDPDVVTALLSLARDTRQDCMALIDPPDNLTRSEAKDWINGLYAGGPAAILDTRFGTASYPWHYYEDEYNTAGIYIAPSGPLAAVIASSEADNNPFLAPAGRKRGYMPYTSELRWNPSKPDQVSMYSIPGQNLNPWVKLRDLGICLRGQKTLQRTATALDRLSAQRTLLYAQKKLDRLAQNFEFDKSNQKTWDNIRDAAKLVLDPILGAGGLNAYVVVCDATTNPAAVQNLNQIRSRIEVQFTKDGEWLIFDWVVKAISD